jgi:hypothetical protein
MAVPEAALSARARRAYEVGRLRTALPAIAFAAVPMVGLSIALCDRPLASAGCGLALAAVLLAAAWRGQPFARGARAGLVAGLGPLLLPMATCFHLCAGGVCLLVPAACIVAALVGGAALGLHARHHIPASSDAGGYLVTALAVAGLVGSLGCVIAGMSGIVGMVVGLTLGTVPVLWWPARATS